MKERGYRFTTVTEGLNIGLSDAGCGRHRRHRSCRPNPAADPADVWRGTVLLWTVRIADGIVYLLAGLFVLVGALTIGRTALLLLLATRHARQRRHPGWSWGPPVTEPVSVIVPAYNEKEGIEAAVRSLAGGDYRRDRGGGRRRRVDRRHRGPGRAACGCPTCGWSGCPTAARRTP